MSNTLFNRDYLVKFLQEKPNATYFPGAALDCPLSKAYNIRVNVTDYCTPEEPTKPKPMPKWAKRFNRAMLDEAKKRSRDLGIYPVHVPMSATELMEMLN